MSNKQIIPLFKVFMSQDVIEPLNNVLMSGYITQGTKVEEFENILKKYFDNDKILSLNSATSGLTLAIRLLKKAKDNWPGLNDDDEILSSPLTCTATNWPILANNLKIKWVDVDVKNCNINIDDLRNKLSYKTKVIMVTHWGGYPVDLDKLKEIQEYCLINFGFKPIIIEDCAHAFGAEYKDKKLGNHGNICIFSLQAIKHLTSGDGGLIVLPNQELYDRAKLLRWYGIDRDTRNYKGKDFRLESDVKEWGYKFHMNDINATIGLYNFIHLEKNLSLHRNNAKFFNENLINVKDVELLNYEIDRISSYWIYTMKVKRKNEFMDHMKKNGIVVSQVHNRNDIHSCVEDFKTYLVNLDNLEKEMICIPVGWWINKEQMEFIVNTIKVGW